MAIRAPDGANNIQYAQIKIKIMHVQYHNIIHTCSILKPEESRVGSSVAVSGRRLLN